MSSIQPVRLDHLSEFGDERLAVRSSSLVKRFGAVTAVDGLDLRVPEGSVYVLLGPNGAGKTTTLRILMDLVRADEGSVAVFAEDPHQRGARVRAQIGFVPERQDEAYGWMRVGRLLRHQAAFFPTWDTSYGDHLAAVFELRRDARFGTLSKGEARRVQLVLALGHRPPLLVLDEPTDGLDPSVRDETLGVLSEHIADCPTTALISTHRVYEVERLAEYAGVIRAGRLIAQTSCERLRRDLRVYRAEVPEGWSGADGLDAVLARRGGTGREILWTVWGDPKEVTGRLVGAGATVREVSPLSLDEAAIALLGSEEVS